MNGRRFKELRGGSPEETQCAFRLAALFFLLTASAYIVKAVKISLFLRGQSASKLPLAYLVTAGVMGFVVTINARIMRRLDRRVYMLASFAFFAAGMIIFRILLEKSKGEASPEAGGPARAAP